VMALLCGAWPPPGWNLAFLTVIGIPALVLLLGNVYCGYLCPFGALQELLGDAVAPRLRIDPNREVWRFARLAKYLILFILVMVLAGSLDPALASVDPLVSVFSHPATHLALVAGVLALSVVYRRFWCRNLCPAGAFLALLNGPRLLRRFLPAVAYRECLFGITGKRDLDCLCCDRCRRLSPAERRDLAAPLRGTPGRRHVLFAAAVILAAGLLLRGLPEAWRAAAPAASPGYAASAGTPREVDMRRLHWLIEQGRLSDEAARYAEPVDSVGP